MLPLSHTQTGDPEKNEKVAFVLLVKLLTKRTVNNLFTSMKNARYAVMPIV